jgi:hypothetical protein
MKSSNEEYVRLLRICRKAARMGRAIGSWWFGPYAGTYFITDARGHRLETGNVGMSLADLENWFTHNVETESAHPDNLKSRRAA